MGINSLICSTTRNAHVARKCGRIPNDKFMSPGFAGQQSIKQVANRRAAARAQGVSQFNLLVMTKAAVNGTRGGHPDTIAACTKVVTQWRDQS